MSRRTRLKAAETDETLDIAPAWLAPQRHHSSEALRRYYEASTEEMHRLGFVASMELCAELHTTWRVLDGWVRKGYITSVQGGGTGNPRWFDQANQNMAKCLMDLTQLGYRSQRMKQAVHELWDGREHHASGATYQLVVVLPTGH